MVNLMKYRVLEEHFTNNAPEGTRLEVKNTFHYNVSFKQDGNRCIGLLKFDLHDQKEPDSFNMKLSIVADFTFGNESKAKIHQESFRQLFPYVRAIVTTLTTAAGMPALILPCMEIKTDAENSEQIEN